MKKTASYIYLAAAALFLLGVIAQVFLAGMVVVARQISWNNHIGLGHSLAGPLLLMLISQYLARHPQRVKLMTWLLFVVYALQADVIIFLRAQAPVVSAFHPVLALADFALGLALLRVAWSLVRQPEIPVGMQPDLETEKRLV